MTTLADVKNGILGVFAPVEDGYNREIAAGSKSPSGLVHRRAMVASGSLMAFQRVQRDALALWPKGHKTVESLLCKEINAVAPGLILGLSGLKAACAQVEKAEELIEPRIEALKKLQSMAAEKEPEAIAAVEKEVQTEPEEKPKSKEKSNTNYWLIAAAAAAGFAAGLFLGRRN